MTASTLTFRGRLPGVDCDAAMPAGPTTVRLDVAAFVGFAERGPLDLPVVVEDINQYRAVFGGEVILATDRGIPVYAHLPGAVRAFFDNGGRRCYVVRVAGSEARATRWLVPGMRLWQPDGGVQAVYLCAAWPGSWSTGYGIGTQLLSEPLAVVAPYRRANGTDPGMLSLAAGSLLPLRTGDLLRLDLGPVLPNLYITVDKIDMVNATVTTAAEIPYGTGPGSPPDAGSPVLLAASALAGLPAETPVRGAWRLQLDLVVRQVLAGAAHLVERWTALGFNTGQVTSWLDVAQPVDDDIPDQTRSMLLRADPDTVAAAATGVFLPFGMDQLGAAAEFTDPGAGTDPSGADVTAGTDPSGVDPGAGTGLDGLAGYAPADLFLDSQLRQETVYSLLTDADSLTVLSSTPRRLHGIHALIGVDEVALVSAPDAVHLGWSPAPPPPPPPASEPPPPPPPVDWSDFRDCAVPQADGSTGGDGTAVPALADPYTWLPLGLSGQAYPILDDPAGYDPAGLLAVHTGLVRLCAARNDAVAILGVPRHFDTAAVLAWLQQLGANASPSQAGRIVMSPLSFAGFWYPWVSVIEPATPELAPLRDEPADGAVCGMIAARELARGVWVAPARVPLRGTVAPGRALSAGDTVRLFNARANLLQSQPGAISTLSAHTLADDPTLQQISVRRLIILLRKIALLVGNRYVFQTNTDRFRQLVRIRFTRLLAALTRAGALAAYQVVTDGGVNTRDDIDNGRLIVTLRVAPTIPIEFITVSLVRAGEDLLDVVVG